MPQTSEDREAGKQLGEFLGKNARAEGDELPPTDPEDAEDLELDDEEQEGDAGPEEEAEDPRVARIVGRFGGDPARMAAELLKLQRVNGKNGAELANARAKAEFLDKMLERAGKKEGAQNESYDPRSEIVAALKNRAENDDDDSYFGRVADAMLKAVRSSAEETTAPLRDRAQQREVDQAMRMFNKAHPEAKADDEGFTSFLLGHGRASIIAEADSPDSLFEALDWLWAKYQKSLGRKPARSAEPGARLDGRQAPRSAMNGRVGSRDKLVEKANRTQSERDWGAALGAHLDSVQRKRG